MRRSPVERMVPKGTRTSKIECGLWRTQNRLCRQNPAGQPARIRLFSLSHSPEQKRTALDGRALGFARWEKLWAKPTPPPKFIFKVMFLHDFFWQPPAPPPAPILTLQKLSKTAVFLVFTAQTPSAAVHTHPPFPTHVCGKNGGKKHQGSRDGSAHRNRDQGTHRSRSLQ